MNELQSLVLEQYCYLTTTGRRSGREHTVEIWFAVAPGGPTMYILSGGRDASDWVKNLKHDPRVKVRIGEQTFEGRGRIVSEGAEDETARRLVVAKYYGRDDLQTTGWEATSLPVVIDLQM